MTERKLNFPDEKRPKCAYCGEKTRGDIVWKNPVLPWIFCSESCCNEYMNKDGEQG